MIDTPRLTLQPWKESDAESFCELTQDAGFLSFPITDWRQPSVDAARNWIRNMEKHFHATKMGAFAVREKPNGNLVGMVAIRILELEKENRPEITYRLRESAWGRGLATEAARAMMAYGFDVLGLEEIAVSITPDNVASIKIAEKLGMKKTGSEVLLGRVAEILRIGRNDR